MDAIVPILSTSNVAVAKRACETILEGGLCTAEFAFREVGAFQVFQELVRWSSREALGLSIGAGSVVEGDIVRSVVDVGGAFIMAPGFDAACHQIAATRGVPYIPGCASVTEILTARSVGCDVVKLFPARQLGGPAFLSAIREPCPWIRAIPTGGIRAVEEDLTDWFGAGAVAVGLGSDLFPSRLTESIDWDGIAERIRGVSHLAPGRRFMSSNAAGTRP